MQPRCRSPITSAGCTSSIGTAISSGIRQRMSTPSPAGSLLPAQYCASCNCCIPIFSPSTVNPRAPATARPICPSSSSSTVPLRLASALANNPSKNSPRERGRCSLEFDHASLLHAKIYTISAVTGSSAMVSAHVSIHGTGGSSNLAQKPSRAAG